MENTYGMYNNPLNMYGNPNTSSTPFLPSAVGSIGSPNSNVNTDYMNQLLQQGVSPDVAALLGRQTQGMEPNTILGMNKNTLQGLQGLAGGAATLFSIYNDYQQNKRAKDAYNIQKSAYNRYIKRDRDFAKNINASGLGTMSVA